MILSDKTLWDMLEHNTLAISPLTPEQVQPASVDIRLGTTFSVVEDSPEGIITMDKEIHYKTIQTDTRRFDGVCGREKLPGAYGAVYSKRRLGGPGVPG